MMPEYLKARPGQGLRLFTVDWPVGAVSLDTISVAVVITCFPFIDVPPAVSLVQLRCTSCFDASENKLYKKVKAPFSPIWKTTSIFPALYFLRDIASGDEAVKGQHKGCQRRQITEVVTTMTAMLARYQPPGIGPVKSDSLIWFAFTLSVTASVIPIVTGGMAGPLPDILANIVAVAGSGGCGWLWLFARSLFRPEKPIERPHLYAVAAIIAIEGGSRLAGPYPPDGPMSEAYRILGNAEGFICIGALVLVFAEVFSGYSHELRKQERRFRQTFALTLGAMIALTLLWVLNADENSMGGRWKETVIIVTAVVAIVGTRLCLSFRKRNPLSLTKKTKPATRFKGDIILGKRILHILQQDRMFATPELKVADLAELLGEQEYKVTQCITGALGFRNFNHLINSYRINSAKEALVDPENKRRPILSVAFDCGFNSLGPFNRAFKQQVGMTPREYRAAFE
jgi:AraC-like DNA-binding protein